MPGEVPFLDGVASTGHRRGLRSSSGDRRTVMSFIRPRSILTVFVAAALSAHAVTRIDFDMSGRQLPEVQETGWNSWVVASAATDSKTVDGITFKISDAGSGTVLKPTWAKILINAPNYARLVGDGVTTDAASGGAIQLEISGLASGTHTLLTYHNAVDGYAWSNVDVSVNGTKQVTVTPTDRAISVDTAAYSFVTFTGTGATILYKATGSNTQNVILNAIALDVSNPKLMAKSPSPEHRDWHVDADAGSLALSWSAGSGAKAHGVYLGTDSASVARATTSSSQFLGSQTGTSFVAKGLSNLKTYYWRIDETDASGTLTRGDVWAFSPRHLAFPGAEGYGRFARGGRGGKVVHVTSLADDGSKGTLRWAVTDSTLGPRTIVFDVGGYIKLGSRLTLADDNVTVAGQTAPAPGICIRSAPFGISGASDAIIRFMKVRIGYGITFDGMGAQGAVQSILDHNTINWTIDEAFSSRQAKNFTLQRTLIAEALNDADHQNYPSGTEHGYAGSIGGDIGTFHHNLLAHNEGRNWSLACGLDGDGNFMGRLDIFDNVVYNWGGRTTDGGCHEVNFVNNYYKPGPASVKKGVFHALNANYDNFPGTQQYYFAGNVMPGHFGLANEDEGKQVSTGTPNGYSPWVSASWFPSYATVQTAAEAYKSVLSDVGQSQPVLDTHDIRVIKEVRDSTIWGNGSKTGLGGLPDRETDVGGFMPMTSTARAASFDTDGDGLPDWYETAIGTNPRSVSGDFSEANADPVGDGYTNLERYLDYMATPHAETISGKSATFDLAGLFRGYQKTSPTYKVGSSACLTGAVSGSVLTVTPKSACGIASLPVTVTDNAGSTMTRNVAVFVTGSTVGVGHWPSAPKSLDWRLDAGRLGVQTDAHGTLTVRDLVGRMVAQVAGTGELGFAGGQLPHCVLIATFEGDGLREQRVVLAVR